MKDKITITHDAFVAIIADETARLLSLADKKGASGMAGMLSGMLVSAFGAAISKRMFKDDEEEEEDGTDS